MKIADIIDNSGNFLVKSVIIPLLLSTAYIFISYQIFISENIFEVFNLYIGLEELYSLFSNESFLLIFWLHFLAVNLFVGNWISSDSQIYLIPRFFKFIKISYLLSSYLLTYFKNGYFYFFISFIKSINSDYNSFTIIYLFLKYRSTS